METRSIRENGARNDLARKYGSGDGQVPEIAEEENDLKIKKKKNYHSISRTCAERVRERRKQEMALTELQEGIRAERIASTSMSHCRCFCAITLDDPQSGDRTKEGLVRPPLLSTGGLTAVLV